MSEQTNHTHTSEIIVLKFGSSVLRDESDLPRVVHEIYRAWRTGRRVLAVVSAFGNMTDELLRRAESLCEQPEQSALAALLATGEATAAALLGLSLSRAGIPFRVLDPAQAGLRTIGDHLDAELVGVDAGRLRNELQRAVVVLPGFVGRDEAGAATLLGRGGSDFTALFLAHKLGGCCVLVKDVDGIYTSDPARSGARPLRFAEATYETACRVGDRVVQAKAVRFAAARGLRFNVTAIGATSETKIGSKVDRLAGSETSAAALRVALLGCGTVGGGVYQRLAALPELFTVAGVATRTLAHARAAGVPEHRITSDLEALIEQQCDVVVELIGGTERAFELVAKALRTGKHVITANKAMLATKGGVLERIAAENGVTLRYSAAVGGALPALEVVAQARECGALRGFSGVLNATCNFVLDRIATGADLAAAVRAAQANGYAEADPTLDLDGTDAAQKLILLARRAFDVAVPFDAIAREGIECVDSSWVREARERGNSVRLVAACRRTAHGLQASVAPLELSHAHPLASVKGAENRLMIESEGGKILLVSGTGAGRWATTEAVIGDLLEARHALCAARDEQFILEECVA